MRRSVPLLLVLLLLAACSDDPAEPTLEVRLVDGDTGTPVAEARLIVESDDPAVGEIARGVTDDDGVWTVTLPAPGTYVVGNLHLADDPPCWWDIPRTEVIVTAGMTQLEFQGLRVCT